MKLILSTRNVMGVGSSIRRSPFTKSNTEFIESLRANFEDHSAIPEQANGTANGNGHVAPQSYSTWTRRTEDTLEVPALDFVHSALQEEREQYDITAKLFFLPGETPEQRATHTREALQLVLKELHMPSIDLLIVSFPGIYFDEEEDCPNKISTRGPVEAEPEQLGGQLEAWKTLEALHEEGLVKRLGIAEFGKDRLQSLLEKVRIKPAVDQINLRDCFPYPKT